MPLYRYEALDPGGRTLRGLVEAESPVAARAKLRKDRVYPVEMTAETPGASANASTGFNLRARRVGAADVVSFTGQMATLLRAGMPVVRALEALTDQTTNPRFKTMLAQIRDSVSQGSTLADSFAAHSPFDGLYVPLVRAGESSGNLDASMAGLASMLGARERLRRKIRGALAYPALMTIVGTLMLALMLMYVLPQVVHIFDDLGQNLPWPTRILLATSSTLQWGWPILLIVLIGSALAFATALRRPEVRVAFDRLKLRAPVAGELSRKAAMARVAGALGTLLRGGVPLLEALASSGAVAGNAALEKTLESAADRVRKGSDLASALSGDPLVPTVAVHMIRVGEESGSLQDMLFEVARLFEEEVETSVTAMTSLLEPVLILVMGVVIGFMVLAILMPIFQLNQASFG